MKNNNTDVTSGNQSKDANGEIGKSEDIQYQLLSKALLDTIGLITLDFIHSEEGGNSSQIIFNIKEILNLSPRKLVMKGDGFINRRAKDTIFIAYKIQKKEFYQAGYYNAESGAMRQIRQLVLPEGDKGTYLKNKESKQMLFNFLNEYLKNGG